MASPVSVAEGYQRWASSYDRDPNPLLALEERYLAPLIAGLSKKRALDLACGTGRWLERLRAHTVWTVGIDNSSAMLSVANAKSAGTLAHGTCENLPFRDACFDLAVCSFALGHIRDLHATAGELARVMERGADVFISDLHPDAYMRGWRVGFRDEERAMEIEMSYRSSEQVIESFGKVGFKCVQSTTLQLGDPEEPFFDQAGKLSYFEEACRVPAVIVFHFGLSGGAASRWA
jgi:ubiquinone/menaquinone biosynthesis C-methylase UbiE